MKVQVTILCYLFSAGLSWRQPYVSQQFREAESSRANSLPQCEGLIRVLPTLLGSQENPATSCRDISKNRPSGYYYIQANSTSSPVQVYCDTNRTSCSCNTTGGWMRVANLDMTDPNQTCPAAFRLVIVNRTESPLRLCGRPGRGCFSTTYPTHGVEYSRVCGRVIGYQSGDGEAFDTGEGEGIDDVYVHGVSLTYSWPRQHIWTFVSARDEVESNTALICPCTRPELNYTGTIPSFIGQDYFCDTGSRQEAPPGTTLYADDPLWDGQGCGGNSTCCQFNNPPWFCRQLSQPTTDDIELRICANLDMSDEDTNLEVFQLFIA